MDEAREPVLGCFWLGAALGVLLGAFIMSMPTTPRVAVVYDLETERARRSRAAPVSDIGEMND